MSSREPARDLALVVAFQLGSWTELGVAARRVRSAVFVREQNIPEALEWDEWDEASLHCVAYAAGEPIATGRLLPDAHIGRMAVLQSWRGGGVGGAVLEKLIEAGRARKVQAFELHAQVHALAFYRRHGFIEIGAPFEEAGIPHRTMRRQFDPGNGG